MLNDGYRSRPRSRFMLLVDDLKQDENQTKSLETPPDNSYAVSNNQVMNDMGLPIMRSKRIGLKNIHHQKAAY